MKIAKIGVDDSYPAYVQRKIVLSNQIALIISLCVAAPFVIVSFIHFPSIAYLPAIGTVVCLSTLALNYFKLQIIGRIVIALVPVLLTTAYAGFINHSGDLPSPPLAMLSLSFALIIFLVFDVREKVYLIILSIIAVAVLLSMDVVNEMFVLEMDNEVIATGYLSKVTVLLSIIVGGGSILILANQSKAEEETAINLLEKSKEANEQLTDKEMQLKENLKKIEDAQQEEKKRHWAGEGISEAIKIMRDYQDLQQLSDDLISFTVQYIEANQGGLFILNEDDPADVYLELVSAYAFDRKKFIEKRVEIGQSLLGQAYLEGEYILLTQIPDNYVNITSGLGQSNPRSVLIMPITVNEKTLGLIELASFKNFEEYQIQFLQTLGENIASTLDSGRNTASMQKLLEESQQQQEEMRAQEEEMRQNQEELQATQEELGRQKGEMEEEITQLKKELGEYKQQEANNGGSQKVSFDDNLEVQDTTKEKKQVKKD